MTLVELAAFLMDLVEEYDLDRVNLTFEGGKRIFLDGVLHHKGEPVDTNSSAD